MISEPLKTPLSLFDVRGKSALITGASGAFGRAVAVSLGALGAKATLAGGTKQDLDAVAGECREVGADVQVLYLRPNTLEGAETMVNAAVEKFGGLVQVGLIRCGDKVNF